MEVIPKGAFGPVWKITNHSGTLVGVTDHYFLFEDNGTVYAIESGASWNGAQHKFSELSTDKPF